MCGGKVAIPPIVGKKRKNSEKRKLRSRDAARFRRSKESEIFGDLSGQLPVGETSAIDKASVMRLAVGYLKIRHMTKLLLSRSDYLNQTSADEVSSSLCISSVEGFLLVISEQGDILYVSENVEEFIGLPQVELIGQSIYDFSHPCDHDDIRELLSPCEQESVSLFVRVRSNLRTRTVHPKTTTYQIIHFMGHKLPQDGEIFLMFIGKTIPNATQMDAPLDKSIFLSRHTPDMKFTDVDCRIKEIVGFKDTELIGKSVYSYHHALDSSSLLTSYRTSGFEKGVPQHSCKQYTFQIDCPLIIGRAENSEFVLLPFLANGKKSH